MSVKFWPGSLFSSNACKLQSKVFINYGPHDNFRLLIEYGFTVSNNPFNYVSMDEEFLSLSLPDEDDAVKQYKLKILTQTGFMGYAF